MDDPCPEIPRILQAHAETIPGLCRADVAATKFLATGQETYLDIRDTGTDNRTNRSLDPAKVLRKQEDEKKTKFSEACREALFHFTPMVFSVDGMGGKEVRASRKRLASKLVEKWKKQYSQVCDFLRPRFSVVSASAAPEIL